MNYSNSFLCYSELTDSSDVVEQLKQSLQNSNENNIINIIDRTTEEVIDSSVKKLPVECVVPLLNVIYSKLLSSGELISFITQSFALFS